MAGSKVKSAATKKSAPKVSSAKRVLVKPSDTGMAPLDLKTFKRTLKERFKFDRNGVFKAPDQDTFLAFVSGKKRFQLGAFNEIPIEDTARHFRASSIMDAPVTDEIVHVTEPGKYFDHVFWNDHESDLYSIDCIEDYEEEIDMDEYGKWPSDRRIKSMPFFDNKVASSLKEFLDGIRTISRKDFYSR